VEKTVKFHDPMKKQRLQTFKSLAAKKTLTTTQNKSIQVKAERNLLGRLLMLSQEHNISLEKLFKYPLGPIPWSLATADGGLAKTDKSKLLHHLEEQSLPPENPPIESCIYIMDGNAHFQAFGQLPQNFEDLALQVFTSLPKAGTIHFVTDTYQQQSIKNMERLRRGSSATYLLRGPKTKLPPDFKSFLLNAENKKQFINCLLSQWRTDKYAQRLQGHQIFLFQKMNACV